MEKRKFHRNHEKTKNFPVACLNLAKARTSDCSRIDVSRV